jgi:organic hydroperoxide reductase OsmC/OhrA
MSKNHAYHVTTLWTGNLGAGTSTYRAYSRSYDVSAPGKAAPIAGSSDPLYRGDRTRYNPEEMLVAAISSCHMLWVLHLCADVGIVITGYTDEASGEMVEHPDGSGEFTRVTLHPRMVITDAARTADAIAIHDKAHHFCCLARSMNFTVEHQPVVTA